MDLILSQQETGANRALKRKRLDSDGQDRLRGHFYTHTEIQEGGYAILGDINAPVTFVQTERQDRRQRLLDSLYVPELSNRLNEIKDVRYGCFDWIFEESEELHGRSRRSSFSRWWSEDASVYFVEGKAGSGKSTLMKYLYEHEMTTYLFREARPQCDTLLVFHAFWLVGNTMQSSFKGLLLSLIHQILSADQALCEVLSQDAVFANKRHYGDWSEKSLQKCLLDLCQNSTKAICFFIDGVDELSRKDDLQDLFDLIDEIAKKPGCKICASGRPEIRILKHFRSRNRMRLQDLTRNDIHRYVHGELSRHFHNRDQHNRENDLLSQVTTIMCEKAEGVFLWVVYVLRNALEGLLIGDDLDLLYRRIEQMPSEIVQLYSHMWQLHNEKHAVHNTQGIAILRFGKWFPMPLFQLVVALDKALQKYYSSTTNSRDWFELDHLCRSFADSLNARCAGLVEWRFSDEQSSWFSGFNCNVYDANDLHRDQQKGNRSTKESALWSWQQMKIQFFHRSVKDFLDTTEEGQVLLDRGIIDEKADRPLVLSSLACFIEDVVPMHYHSACDVVDYAASCSDHPDSVFLLKTVDKICGQLLDQRVLHAGKFRYNWVSYLVRSVPEMLFEPEDFVTLVLKQLALGDDAWFANSCVMDLCDPNWTAYYKANVFLTTQLPDLRVATQLPDLRVVEQSRVVVQLTRTCVTKGFDMSSVHSLQCRNGWVLVHSPSTYLVAVSLSQALQRKLHDIDYTGVDPCRLLNDLTRFVAAGQQLCIFIYRNLGTVQNVSDQIIMSAVPPRSFQHGHYIALSFDVVLVSSWLIQN